MRCNQPTRGNRITVLVRNEHLLFGKIPKRGNSPRPLTGQP